MVSESRLGTSSCLLTTLINQAIKKITEQLLLSKLSYLTLHRIFLASRLITSLTITINILAQRNKQNKVHTYKSTAKQSSTENITYLYFPITQEKDQLKLKHPLTFFLRISLNLKLIWGISSYLKSISKKSIDNIVFSDTNLAIWQVIPIVS